MLFHKEKKLCLYEPTKTGSTTARHFLMGLGWSFLRPTHATPEHFIGKYPNLTQYKSYVFFRNPLDRFLSCIHHVKRDSVLKHLDMFRTDENSMKTINPEGNPVYTWSDLIAKFLPYSNKETSLDHLSYEDIVVLFDKFESEFSFMFAPQVTWMTAPDTEVLDFSNYEAELRRISGATDPEKYPIPKLNVSEQSYKGEVTDKVVAFVRAKYAVDYQFAKDVLGKEY